MDWLIVAIGSGAGIGVVGIVLVAWLLIDARCPHCHHRNWSKGVPAWRCRRCGMLFTPGRHHPPDHPSAPIAPVDL